MAELAQASAGPSGPKVVRYCPICGTRWDDAFQYGEGIHCSPDSDGCGAKIRVRQARDE